MYYVNGFQTLMHSSNVLTDKYRHKNQRGIYVNSTFCQQTEVIFLDNIHILNKNLTMESFMYVFYTFQK